MKPKSLGLFAALLSFLVLAPLPHAIAENAYHLGIVLGLSGTGATYSQEAIEAVEIAVNEINAQGGFLGQHPIEIFIRDSQTRPEIAKQQALALIEKKKVRCIIGTYSSACAIAIKPICRQKKVLHLASISNSENITKIDFSPYTYSVVPNTYMMAKGVVLGIATLIRDKGWKRYATIASDYAWGRSSQEIQVQLITATVPSIELVGTYWPPLGETQFNAYIVSLMAKKPDFVLGTIGGTDNAFFMRDAREYRLFKKIAYPGGLISVSELIRQSQSIRRGRYARCRAPFFAHHDNALMKHFVETYRSKYDRFPTDWSVMSYDAVHVLKQAIESAGRIDSESVKGTLKGMRVSTTRGHLYFRPIDNQLSCSAYFGRVSDSPDYPMPIYSNLQEIKGPDIWRPEVEIIQARSNQ